MGRTKHQHFKHWFRKRKVAIILAGFLLACGVASAWLFYFQARFSPTPDPLQLTSSNTNKPVYGIALADPFLRQSPAQIDTQLAAIKKLGFTDVRFTVSWYIVQPVDAKTYDWKLYDRLIASMQKNDLNGLAIINYTPAWARASACPTSAYCPPAQPKQFGDFAAAVAKRYAPKGVHYYEIWNEENIKSFWQPTPSAAIYATVLKAAYPAIKAADPKSTVLVGGMSGVSVAGPGYLEPRTYLQDLYKAGSQGYFDAVGYHAYTFPEKPNDNDGGKNAWSKMASVTPNLRRIMIDNGDGAKKIWITEVGAPTNGPGALVSSSIKRTAKSDHVDGDLQSAIATQALENSTKLPWLGGLFWYTYKDKGVKTDSPENFYGLVDYNDQPKPTVQVFSDFLKKQQE